MTKQREGLRERTRKAVQRQITETADALFTSRGYELTTIEDIAIAAGISPRSIFRYFPTKEYIVLGKLDLIAEEMLSLLDRRPAEEPVWQSLRRMFDRLTVHEEKAQGHQVSEAVKRVVFGTPVLFASYLQKMQQLQSAVVIVLLDRAKRTGQPYAADDPAPRALTAAAFGCLIAAEHAWLAGAAKGTIAEAIDRSMATLTPSCR
jgi:AcrR family transcriptional regulator